jgi:DNA polymerase
LLDAVAQDTTEIHAWNASFEFNVWNAVCAKRFGWPELPIERFHCTMATAALAGLPLGLDEASRAVGASYVKDTAGHAIMLRMARPRRYDTKGNPEWWHRDKANPAKLQSLIAYNIADVWAERDVRKLIPRMSRHERRVWLADQRMNQRGLPVDQKLLEALGDITKQELTRINLEITRLTGGAVLGVSQNLKLLQWVRDRGYPYATLERETLTGFLGSAGFGALSLDTKAVLELRAEAAKTSTAKIASIRAYSHLDDIVHGALQYGGAVRTLRWAGRGPQVQNFPKPVILHIPEAIREILLGADAGTLRHIFGKPLDVVSSCLRGVFKAPDGKTLLISDYKNIEAIVLPWLAGFDELLEVFRRGEDVYSFTAKQIGSDSRTFGKVLRLGLGYGMGGAKFLVTAHKAKIMLTLIEAKQAVTAFRASNGPIVRFWRDCEKAAREAILNPGDEFEVGGKISFRMARPDRKLAGALLMRLPSGRHLVYRDARVNKATNRITFWGVNQFTRKWCEQDTYGAKLAENATQAIARDLLAEALLEFEEQAPPEAELLATIHDELIALCPCNRAVESYTIMTQAMSTPPAWGVGLPLSCTGGLALRYGKI